MIKCSKCGLDKMSSEFYKNHYDCKKCWNKYCSERRKRLKSEDPTFLEKRRAYLREWREKNKDKNGAYWKNELQREKESGYVNRKNSEYRKMANESVKKWRLNNPEQYAKHKKQRSDRDKHKIYARNELYKAIASGKIIRPKECSKCLKECKPHGHHEDYTKPLEVIWLCNVCHRQAHGKLLDVKP